MMDVHHCLPARIVVYLTIPVMPGCISVNDEREQDHLAAHGAGDEVWRHVQYRSEAAVNVVQACMVQQALCAAVVPAGQAQWLEHWLLQRRLGSQHGKRY